MMQRIPITWGLVIRFCTVAIFVLLSVASLMFSAYLFVTVNSTYTFVLACAFLGLSLFAGFFNFYASVSYFRSYFYDRYIDAITARLKPLKRLPTVAVIMPVYNEDTEVVQKDMKRLLDLDYPKNKIKFYMVDDSTTRGTKEKLERFCKNNGVIFFHRDNRKGYKAGAVNNMLKHSKEEFVAIIDADEYLINTGFLKDLLPYFSDDKVAYVQTEKRSQKGTFFSEAVDLFDGFFFRFIQPHRALNNTALFAGSCGVIRRSAIDVVGGFPEYVIEDTFFSLESDMHNYKSIYVPKVYALGKPMKTYTALVKQQWRYNYGDTQFIRYYAKRSMESKRLSPWAMLDYIGHGFGLNYLSLVLIAFTVLSVFVSFSTLPFVHMTIKQLIQATYISRYLEVFGGIAFVLSMIAPAVLTKVYFGSLKKGFMIFFLNFALAIARSKAAIAAITHKSSSWKPLRAGTTRSHDIRYAIMNTKAEIVMSASLLSMGFFAMMTSNIPGTVWLLTYGVLYLFATVLIYKYG